MTRSFTTLLTGVFVALAASSAAHEYEAGALVIEHPYALETAVSASSAGGYLTIRNTGDAADRLVAVRSDFPQTQIHTTEVDASGVARMIHLDAIDVPAGGDVTLAPQGLHVMFMGLSTPLLEGEEVEAVLVFETAGEVPVVFNVEARGADAGNAGHDH